jgi:hypothetical protein
MEELKNVYPVIDSLNTKVDFPIYLKDSNGDYILDEYGNPIIIQNRFSYFLVCDITQPNRYLLVDEFNNYITDEYYNFIIG